MGKLVSYLDEIVWSSRRYCIHIAIIWQMMERLKERTPPVFMFAIALPQRYVNNPEGFIIKSKLQLLFVNLLSTFIFETDLKLFYTPILPVVCHYQHYILKFVIKL